MYIVLVVDDVDSDEDSDAITVYCYMLDNDEPDG